LVTLANRTDLTTLADIHGQRLSAISPSGFGGFLLQWRVLHEVGMSVLIDPAQVSRQLLSW
jgi:hypothetical protein